MLENRPVMVAVVAEVVVVGVLTGVAVVEITGTIHGGGYSAHDRCEFSMDLTQQPAAPPGR